MSLCEAREAFLAHCSHRRLSAHTIQAYRQDLIAYENFAGASIALDRITDGMLLEYRAHIVQVRRASAATTKRRIAGLRSFFSWATERKLVKSNPFTGLRIGVKLPERLPRALSRDEAVQLVRARRRLGPTGSLVVGLFIATGIRVSEVVALRLGDVDADSGRITIFGKGSRERTVFVTDDVLQAELKSYLAGFRGRDCVHALFADRYGALSARRIRRIVKRLAKYAGLGRTVTPHVLRHTAATLLLEEGADIRFVQRLLGHQSVVTTQIYTRVTDKSLEDAVRRANVLGNLCASA